MNSFSSARFRLSFAVAALSLLSGCLEGESTSIDERTTEVSTPSAPPQRGILEDPVENLGSLGSLLAEEFPIGDFDDDGSIGVPGVDGPGGNTPIGNDGRGDTAFPQGFNPTRPWNYYQSNDDATRSVNYTIQSTSLTGISFQNISGSSGFSCTNSDDTYYETSNLLLFSDGSVPQYQMAYKAAQIESLLPRTLGAMGMNFEAYRLMKRRYTDTIYTRIASIASTRQTISSTPSAIRSAKGRQYNHIRYRRTNDTDGYVPIQLYSETINSLTAWVSRYYTRYAIGPFDYLYSRSYIYPEGYLNLRKSGRTLFGMPQGLFEDVVAQNWAFGADRRIDIVDQLILQEPELVYADETPPWYAEDEEIVEYTTHDFIPDYPEVQPLFRQDRRYYAEPTNRSDWLKYILESFINQDQLSNVVAELLSNYNRTNQFDIRIEPDEIISPKMQICVTTGMPNGPGDVQPTIQGMNIDRLATDRGIRYALVRHLQNQQNSEAPYWLLAGQAEYIAGIYFPSAAIADGYHPMEFNSIQRANTVPTEIRREGIFGSFYRVLLEQNSASNIRNFISWSHDAPPRLLQKEYDDVFAPSLPPIEVYNHVLPFALKDREGQSATWDQLYQDFAMEIATEGARL